MRYRSVTTAKDFSRDVAAFVNFVGEGEYRHLLSNLGKSLNLKGYVTEADDLRFSLELQLLNLELLRHTNSGIFVSVPESIHEASDFIIGLGQTIPVLSSAAKKKVRGQIISGLKTNGLRPLQHEMRVAGKLSKSGYEVTFGDLEGVGSYDFLAEKDGLTYEVEAKSLPIFSGWPIKPQDADKFFLEIDRKFDGRKDKSQIPILNVTVKSGLPTNRTDLLKLVAACNAVAITETGLSYEDYAKIQFVGKFTDAPYEKIAAAAHIDQFLNRVYVYTKGKHPKVVIRLRSEGKSKFSKNILTTIADSAKRQFSHNNPGVIWTHIDYISRQLFDDLTLPKEDRSSLFDSIANAVFQSSKRNHIIQLVFSGGAFLYKNELIRRSSYKHTIYNSPTSDFEAPMLFAGGRTRRSVNRLDPSGFSR